MIPVSIVTGFLGSGKTTLISRILRDPAFGRTAVIVNEFGEVALDHDLIASSDDSVLTLNTGCLCCAVQTDLARTVMDLWQRREAGLANYDRVLIETSGLSDPAPMLQAMLTDNGVFATHRLGAVVTLVDVVHGEQSLQEHAEARHQVALADRLLLSKTDLRPASDSLLTQLAMLNPGAPPATTAQVTPAVFFAEASIVALAERLAELRRPPGPGPSGNDQGSSGNGQGPSGNDQGPSGNVRNGGRPTGGPPPGRSKEAGGQDLGDRSLSTPRGRGLAGHREIETFTVMRERPLPALALTMLLQAVAEHCGSRLLRLKGLVAIAEMPGRPAVIHGVRHVVSPPDFLDRWPGEDERTRIVFITRGVPRHFVSRLLDAIEEEVREAMTEVSSAGPSGAPSPAPGDGRG